MSHIKKNQISVLHLISSFEVGGVEKLLISFLKEMSLSDQPIKHSVIIINNLYDVNLVNQLKSVCENVYIINRNPHSKNVKNILTIIKLIKKLNIDIINSYNEGSKKISYLCKLSCPKVRLIYSVHNCFVFDKYGAFNRFLHNFFIRRNICISNAVVNYCNINGIKNTHLIYNGIDIKKFSAFKKYRTESNMLRIVNVSRITHKIKGQDILIKALGICKKRNLKFVCNIVGGVYEYDIGSLEYLKELTDENNLYEEIHFCGNQEDIPRILSENDLFILPSRSEGFGLVVAEAMAVGLPVIASNLDAVKELIVDNENGILFECENHYDLAEKIMLLQNTPDLKEKIISNATEDLKKFDISTMYENYGKLYKSVL